MVFKTPQNPQNPRLSSQSSPLAPSAKPAKRARSRKIVESHPLLEPTRTALRLTRVHLQKALPHPVQAAGTITQLTNSPGTHEVSCLCNMPENAEEGLLVQCDSCNKWVHCRCYNLDEQTIGRDDYSFFCMTCLPRPVSTRYPCY